MTPDIRNDPRETAEDFEALEERNRLRLSGWWNQLGREPEYPTNTGTAVELCQAADYAVDADWVLAAISHGWVPPVPREAGRLQWDATAIVSLACAAETRRKWVPFSKMHGHKLRMIEKLQELCSREGASAFRDLDGFDFEGLLALQLQVSGDAGAVEMLNRAIHEKLKKEGILN